MKDWEITNAQQAVNIVAPVMAGQPRHDIEAELRHWLARRGATLPEPQYSLVVEAVALGNRTVTLKATHAGVLCPGHPQADDTTGTLEEAGSMAQYIFLDGPLAGEALSSSDVHAHGDRIEVGVVDVCEATDDVPSFTYAVHAPARPGHSGGLRYARAASPPRRSSSSA